MTEAGDGAPVGVGVRGAPGPGRAHAGASGVGPAGSGRIGEAAVSRREARKRALTYGALITGFSGGLVGALGAAAAGGRLPARPSAGDVLLVGSAAHKLSRTLSKERVTAVVRAPFVEGGPGEEHPVPEGARRAIGELVTCPSCLGLWFSALGVVGVTWAPAVTRAVASVFAADAISDFLHVAYRAGRERA